MNINYTQNLHRTISYLNNTAHSSFEVLSKKASSLFPKIEDPPLVPSYSPEAIKYSIREIKNHYMDSSWAPGLFCAFTFPKNFIHSCRAWKKARESKNKDALLDSKLKIVNTSINTVYSIASLLSIAISVKILFSYGAFQFAQASPHVGIIASSISGIIECRNIRRQIRFLSKCEEDIALLQADMLTPGGLIFLHKYIMNDSHNIENLAKLANRVTPWYAEKMALELPDLLKKIGLSEDPSIRQEHINKALALLKDAKIQAEKKLIYQVLSLLATALAIIGFIGMMVAQPIGTLILIFAISNIIGAGSYVYYRGVRKHIGWEFSLKESLPSCMIKINQRLWSCFKKTTALRG